MMTLADYVQADMAALRAVAAKDKNSLEIHNRMARNRLLDFAQRAMAARLENSDVDSHAGWWNDRDIEALRQSLLENVTQGRMLDVMILAAMVYTRELADGVLQPVGVLQCIAKSPPSRAP